MPEKWRRGGCVRPGGLSAQGTGSTPGLSLRVTQHLLERCRAKQDKEMWVGQEGNFLNPLSPASAIRGPDKLHTQHKFYC